MITSFTLQFFVVAGMMHFQTSLLSSLTCRSIKKTIFWLKVCIGLKDALLGSCWQKLRVGTSKGLQKLLIKSHLFSWQASMEWQTTNCAHCRECGPVIAGKAKAGMTHSDCGWTCGCAGKTVKSLENTCHTWALPRWWFTTKRRYIKCIVLSCWWPRVQPRRCYTDTSVSMWIFQGILEFVNRQ